MIYAKFMTGFMLALRPQYETFKDILFTLAY